MLGEESSSNTCATTPPWTYHVFLSFRGEDTRLNFISHLYAALQRKGITAYRDDQQLERGEQISSKLTKAIEESLASVIVLSKNYASSTWCLDELQKILESKRVLGREVFPIFHGVTPSEVRHQKESFAEAFREHERRFEDDKGKVQRWRDSLKEVAGISGWESKDLPEAELIEDIVEKVWIKLSPKLPSHDDGIVGIESRENDMISLLSLGCEDVVSFIGIWGMGGIGKTTLARIIYERIFRQFEICCFLPNVREVSKRFEDLVHLQRKLLSCLKIRNLEIDNLYDGKKTIKNFLCNKKVLLVLDDISHESQLENLAANEEWFGPGSRIIVTTRDKHLLISHGIYRRYEMKILNVHDSFQLFTQQAFKRARLQEGYIDISKTMVQYAKGLPLALDVLGSFLRGRSLYEWEEALEKVKRVPPNDIVNTLRISYDGLEDDEKTLFLDIAFFFVGQDKVEVTRMLKDCGLNPTIGINILIEKSLVRCHEGILEMHDLLQNMARNVVFQESPNDASKRSRLCSLEEVNQVLRKNKETELIQGIVLKSSEPFETHGDPKALSKMCNLRVLIILCDLKFPLGLESVPSSIKIIEWKGYPLQDLPLRLPLDELVDLKMHYSKIKRLWNGTQYFRKLKSIDLSDSRDLVQTPNIIGVPYLERLVLKGCKSLVMVHQSIAEHKNLAILNLEDCINIKTLPRKLEMDALTEFILSGCSNLKKLPEFGESMKCLSMLYLHDCKNLVCLPESMCNLKSLRNLSLVSCSKLSSLPNSLHENNALEVLDVSETAIREVPSSIRELKSLKRLSFRGCSGLINNSWSLSLPNGKVLGFGKYPLGKDLKLPPLSFFSTLMELDLSYCNLSDELIPNDLGCLSSLEILNLSGNNFVNLETSIASLAQLRGLYLSDCPMLKRLPVLPAVVRGLFTHNCTQMTFDPQIIQEFFEIDVRYICLNADTIPTAVEFIASQLLAVRWKFLPWIVLSGSEIPPWLCNQDDFFLSPQLTDCECCEDYESIASIIVDLPDYCHSSQRWGVTACFSLESTMEMRPRMVDDIRHSIYIRWAFKASDPKLDPPLPFDERSISYFSGPHLYYFLFERVPEMMPRSIGGQNKLQLAIDILDPQKRGKLIMRNCACRLVCKEDAYQLRRRGMAISEVHEMPPRITEITDELKGDETQTGASDFGEPNIHSGSRQNSSSECFPLIQQFHCYSGALRMRRFWLTLLAVTLIIGGVWMFLLSGCT